MAITVKAGKHTFSVDEPPEWPKPDPKAQQRMKDAADKKKAKKAAKVEKDTKTDKAKTTKSRTVKRGTPLAAKKKGGKK